MNNLIERTFGRLKVIRRVYPNIHHSIAWECTCTCGSVTVRNGGALTRTKNPVRSCGCIARERIKKYATKHGKSGTREYHIHLGMKERCNNSKGRNFPDYGGRGIKICERWSGEHGFENFYTDMGPRPRGTSIERLDVNGNYSPENCIWGTSAQQHKNRRKFVALTNYTNDEIIQEFERRFPAIEYGIEGC